jgi:hypothetical protein
MSDYPNIVVQTPMFGKRQFGVPVNNSHSIRCNLLTSEFQVKNPVINPTSTFKMGTGKEVLTNPEALSPS